MGEGSHEQSRSPHPSSRLRRWRFVHQVTLWVVPMALALLRKLHPFEDPLETKIRAQGIPIWVNLHLHQSIVLSTVSLLQPLDSVVLIARVGVKPGNVGCPRQCIGGRSRNQHVRKSSHCARVSALFIALL